LLLSIIVMLPTAVKVHQESIQPWMEKKLTLDKAIEKGQEILKNFMLRQTRNQEILLFLQIRNQKPPSRREDLRFHQVMPAFVLSEIRRAFEMGILIFFPFVMLDLLVGLGLYSLGIHTISAQTISFVLKITIFIMADGWNLLVSGILQSFQ
ncbi:MAG: flagellar biosynthetic protein FliP, partial [Planctomycetota bacterium]